MVVQLDIGLVINGNIKVLTTDFYRKINEKQCKQDVSLN